MNSIVLLTRLQIKQALGGARGAIEKRTGAHGAMVGTLLIGLALFVGLGWLGYSAHDILGGYGLDTVLYNILFLSCGMLTFTFSLPTVLSSFFGSSDTNDLLFLPVSPLAIVVSKALGVLAASYLWTFLFIVGPLAGWGIAAGAGVHYWVTYVLAVIFAPLMPTAYAGTLSIVIARVFKRIRRKDAITTLTTVITLGVSVCFYFVSSGLNLKAGVAQALGGMGEAMGSVVMAFPAYGFAVYALAHPDPLGILMFLLLSFVAFAVFVIVARVLYMQIVTQLSSGAGKSDTYKGGAAQEQTPVLKAMLATEIHKVIRNSSILLNYVAYPLLVTPVMFGTMFFNEGLGKLLQKMGENPNINAEYGGFALAILMGLAALDASSNKIAATSVSREGSNWIHMKYIPVPIQKQLLAKALPGFAVNALITVTIIGGAGFLLITKMRMNVVLIASGLVLMLGAAWLMACVGAWTESRSPLVEWGNDGDVNAKVLKGVGGELRSLLVGLVNSALPLLVSPLVKLDPLVFMPVLAVVGVVVAVVLGRVLLAAAAKNIEVFE